MGWRNSFLGIDSGAPYTFKNTGSVFSVYAFSTVSMRDTSLPLLPRCHHHGRNIIQSPNLKRFMEPRNRFQGIDSASLDSLAGRYEKQGSCNGPPGWESIPWNRYSLESIPGLLKRLQIRALVPAVHPSSYLLSLVKLFAQQKCLYYCTY
jgi:hypothetical protein